jgi:threonine/homoserine/homoserine lactone efflux protein
MVIVSAGVNYGIRKTFSFVSGATIGFTLLLLCIGFGFYEVINLYPSILKYLAITGSLYIVYMGYVIGSSKPELDIKKQKQPTFMQGFLLQWLNPKAWIACVAGVSLFSSPENKEIFLTFSLVYFLVCYLSLFSWAVLGDKVKVFLSSESRLKLFNLLMGGLLVGTAIFLLYSQFS